MMTKNASDSELIARSIQGDRAGFSALVSRHYDMIFRTAWKWCANREDAQDIAQDVCVRLGKAIGSYSGEAKFTTWLYRVVLNSVRDHQRKQASERRKLDAWEAEPSRATDQPAFEGQQGEKDGELWSSVRQLSPKQRDAVLLVYGEEMSHAEAAKILECAEGTVSSHIHDAKLALKKMMATEADQIGQSIKQESAGVK